MHTLGLSGKMLPMAKVTEVTRALGVRVPKKLIKQLKQIALDRDCSLAEIVTPALEALVAENCVRK